MTQPPKLDQKPEYWDRLFAPSSCLAIVTTVDLEGRVNAASYGTCTRVNHDPVYIAFTTGVVKDNARNVLATGEFVVNLPRFDRASLEKVRICGLPFAYGVNELEKAKLTALPAKLVKPPRILECPRHFECKVEWTKEWVGRVMVVGEVVAASVDADCVDEQGWVRWERVKSAHFCGAPYINQFVAAYETMAVGVPYEGPEIEDYERNDLAKFRDTPRHG